MYTLDDTVPTSKSGELYTKPIKIDKDTHIIAVAYDDKKKRNTNLSSRLIARDVMNARDSENRKYREIESSGISVYSQYFNGFANEHGKFIDKNGKSVFTANNMLLDTKDNLGNTIFNYLQEITSELRWQRENDTMWYPDMFLPILEETGEIQALDYYVYELMMLKVLLLIHLNIKKILK